jgi:uncharacterized protein (TIGR02453 family)
MSGSYFTPALFGFLAELRSNNRREWFLANKHRYESEVRDPMLRFIADFGPELRKISRHMVADPRPNGGSMMRVYRDTRFARDKTPYKTNAAAHFNHISGKDIHAPGFYIHLAPDEVFVAAGMWHPEASSLGKIRDAIVKTPSRWKKSIGEPRFASTFELGGDSLKRPPQGYDPNHPLIADLKRKDFVAGAELTPQDVCSPRFMSRFADMCAAGAPLMKFLTTAVGLRW